MKQSKVDVFIRSVKQESADKLKEVASSNGVTLGKAFDMILESVKDLEIEYKVQTSNKKSKK